MAKELAGSISPDTLYDREQAEEAITHAESEERCYPETLAKFTYIDRHLPAQLHKLLVNGVQYGDQEVLGELVEALRDFVTELEQGAHRGTFTKDDHYTNLIDILTDDLGLFDIAWTFVKVVTPLRGNGHYDNRSVHLLRMLTKQVSDSSISRTVALGAKVLERSEFNELVKSLSTLLRNEEPGLLTQGLPRLLATCPLEFSTIFHVVVDICAAALACDRQDIAESVIAECSWLACEMPSCSSILPD